MISVISGTGCVGFVVPRRHQFQAYTAHCRSIGLYGTAQAAIDATLRAAETDQAA